MKKILCLMLSIMLMALPAYGASQWDKLEPLGTRSVSDLDYYIASINNEAIDRVVTNFREGCKMAYASATTITVEDGEVVCSNAAGTVRKLRKNTSDTTVAWTTLDAGTEAVSTTYYLYAVADTDATTFTVIISASTATPTGPTYYKRLGSFYNNSDGDIDKWRIVNDNVKLTWGDFEDELRVYDSGWFAVSVTTDYTKTHSLGTINVIPALWFSTDSGGADAELCSLDAGSTTEGWGGASINTLTTTTVKVSTGGTYVSRIPSASSPYYTTRTSGYFRLILLALE